MSAGANPVRQGASSREVPPREPRRRRGSTGPRTAAGKRRSSLNRLKKGLCPPWVMRDLMVRREDPEAFRRLHRELIAWLAPVDARTGVIVETLAEVWWEKLRRKRNWVGAGLPDTGDIDSRIDDLIQRFVHGVRLRHRKWRYRMEQSLGADLYGPAVVRARLEGRLVALGGKAPARIRAKRPVEPESDAQAQTGRAGRMTELDPALAELVDLLHQIGRQRAREPQL